MIYQEIKQFLAQNRDVHLKRTKNYIFREFVSNISNKVKDMNENVIAHTYAGNFLTPVFF